MKRRDFITKVPLSMTGLGLGFNVFGCIGRNNETVGGCSEYLKVSKNTTANDENVVAGTNYVAAGSFIIEADKAEGVIATMVVVKVPQEYVADIIDMYVSSNGSILGAIKAVPEVLNNFGIDQTVSAGMAKNFEVRVSIKAGIKTGATFKISVQVSGVGLASYKSYASDFVKLQTITIVGSGTLSASKGIMPYSAILLAGSTGNYVAEYVFSAAQGGFIIDKLKLRISDLYFSASTAAVKIRYTDRNGDFKLVNSALYPGSIEADGNIAIFTGLAIHVPAAHDKAYIDIYIDPISINSGNSGGFSGANGVITLLHDQGFSATGDSGDHITSFGDLDLSSNVFYVRKSKPTFVLSDVTVNGSSGEANFTAVADNAGNVDIKQLGFKFNTNGCQVSQVYLYDPSNATQLTDVPVNPDLSGTVKLPIGATNDTNVLTIGSTVKNYKVRFTVTGYNNAEGDFVRVNFAQDTAPFPMDYALGQPIANMAAITTSGANIIWSDRSAPAHSVNTFDWANGYLIKYMVQSF